MRADNTERFERLLAALERELIEATDQEILEAASDLGMTPAMKGSAAFFGIATIPPLPLRPMDSLQSWESADWFGIRRRFKDDPPR